MPVFVVERYLGSRQVAGLTDRLRRATDGSAVTWLGSIVLPADDACLCLFDAASEADVVAVNDRAGADIDRVAEAFLVRPGEPSRNESL